jgi:hypothetical protein
VLGLSGWSNVGVTSTGGVPSLLSETRPFWLSLGPNSKLARRGPRLLDCGTAAPGHAVGRREAEADGVCETLAVDVAQHGAVQGRAADELDDVESVPAGTRRS